MKITALIVTYNRLELLKESIEALFNQTYIPDNLIIYNNNSTDGTEEFLEGFQDSRIRPVHASENTGGAGGFHYGIKMACESGADWIWVMDDDTIAEPDALQKLVESPFFPQDESGNATGYLASRVDWIDGTRHLMNYIEPVYPWHHFHGLYDNCYRITNSTFVSMLINRKAVEKVGLPIKEFFIWGDDWEYSGRISDQFNCYYISDSVAIHKTPVNEESNVGNINSSNYWKYKYDARNSAALFEKSFIGKMKFLIELIKKIRMMALGNVKLRYRLNYIFYAIGGLSFNYRKYIEFPNNSSFLRS